jgi:uncharacterized membrane protein (GlpM family)
MVERTDVSNLLTYVTATARMSDVTSAQPYGGYFSLIAYYTFLISLFQFQTKVYAPSHCCLLRMVLVPGTCTLVPGTRVEIKSNV